MIHFNETKNLVNLKTFLIKQMFQKVHPFKIQQY
jgi:hypothetical protein